MEKLHWSQNESVFFLKKGKAECHFYYLLFVLFCWMLTEMNQSGNELKWKSSFASIFIQRRILQKAENGNKKWKSFLLLMKCFLALNTLWLKEKQFGFNLKLEIQCISNLVIRPIWDVTNSDHCNGLALKCTFWIKWYLDGWGYHSADLANLCEMVAEGKPFLLAPTKACSHAPVEKQVFFFFHRSDF